MARSDATETPRLFAKEELVLEQTGVARLRQLARRPSRPLTLQQQRQDENRATMKWLREMGQDLSERFKLKPHVLEKEREGITDYYGICYEDGLIRIRLRHATTGKLLKESSLVDTLCHELAHLRYLDHSIRFRKLYQRILQQARELGYYKPGPVRDKENIPSQLMLFDDICGTSRRRRRVTRARPV